MLRANALGNFGTLLHAASKDPAMLIYLDSAQNRKGQPNENFAREVMELFTLGEGHYSEQDIKEAARAFTGWSIDRDTGEYLFRPRRARLRQQDGARAQRAISTATRCSTSCSRSPRRRNSSPPSCGANSCRPTPIRARSSASRRHFRGPNYDIKVALRALLLCDAFWARENRGTLVKSPVEFVVGTLRQLDVAPATRRCRSPSLAAGMGQNLFSPPNVKGWPGGERLDQQQHAARAQAVRRSPGARDEAPPPMIGGRDAALAVPMRAEPCADAALRRARTKRRARSALAREADRGVRNLHFDAAALARRAQPEPRPRTRSMRRRRCCSRCRRRRHRRIRATTRSRFVRATLLDPVYQLK